MKGSQSSDINIKSWNKGNGNDSCEENLNCVKEAMKEGIDINENKKRELVQWNEFPLLKRRNVHLFEENELSGVVNALPYIDAFDKEYEERAKQLITEEMNMMKEQNEIKNYLEDIDIPYTKYLSDPDSLLYKELQRCEENRKLDNLRFDHYNLDDDEEKDKYNTDAAPNKNLCIEEWKEKIKRYETILEYSHTALINIELMDKYKSVSWEEHLKLFSKIDIDLQNNINSLKNEIEDINKKRKLHQLGFVDDITSLQNERKEYKRKSDIILVEISRLLAENRLLKYKQNVN